jgi:hypothetical protein
MSGKVTLLSGENLTLTTAVRVLAAIQTAAVNSLAAPVRIKRLEISQSGSTTLGMVRGEISTRTTAGTLTTTSAAPANVRPVGGPASGLAGNTSVIGGVGRSGINASVDSGGTYTQVMPFNFPNTAGYLFKPDPDQEIWFPPSTVFVVRFLADPATLTGWTFSLWLVEE